MPFYNIAGNQIEMTEEKYNEFDADRKNLSKVPFMRKWSYLWDE